MSGQRSTLGSARPAPLFSDSDLEYPGDRIRTLSLFSGAGGLDIGFHDAGYDIVAAVEIEPAYAATISANIGIGRYFGPNVRVHCEDIRDFDARPYADEGIRCVIGGPPCQTFSAAGRRSGGVLGLDDERGQLFRAYVNILDIIKPSVFIFENVYGLPGANGGGPWREIVESFAGAGYDLHAEVLDAADFGVAQHRERLIMVGSRVGAFGFPEPTHGPDSSSGRPLLSAKAALAGLKAVRASAPLGGLYGHLLELVPPGLNYSYFTREMGHPAPQFAWRSKFHDFLYKADPTGPVRTIKSKPGKFTGPFHWDNRHFNAEELKRLQSFPADFEIVGSYNKTVEQIGNSVPPKLGRVIAVSVREQLLEPVPDLTYPVRSEGFKSTFRQRQRERHALFDRVARRAIARMGSEELEQASAPALIGDSYYAAFTGWFQRVFPDVEPELDKHDLVLSVTAERSADAVRLAIAALGPLPDSSVGAHIRVSGLEKYMDHTDVIDVTAELRSVGDILPVWAVIEHELVRQSRFFSLIDIYGHYANRGDTVVVETEVHGSDVGLVRAVNYFGNSSNCGVPMPLASAAAALGVSMKDVPGRIDALRRFRWDVRAKGTHRTLAEGSVLCTYPFPALSGKAHFDKGLAGSGVAPTRDEAKTGRVGVAV